MPLVLAGLFGLLIGSFLNVCIYRLPRDLSIVWPASRCTTCGRELSWYENIPVFSYVALRGRCRSCGERISPMYPVIETVTALIFAGALAWYGLTPLFAARLVFACAMLVLFIIDLQHQILPERDHAARHRHRVGGEHLPGTGWRGCADRGGGRRRYPLADCVDVRAATPPGGPRFR